MAAERPGMLCRAISVVIAFSTFSRTSGLRLVSCCAATAASENTTIRIVGRIVDQRRIENPFNLDQDSYASPLTRKQKNGTHDFQGRFNLSESVNASRATSRAA